MCIVAELQKESRVSIDCQIVNGSVSASSSVGGEPASQQKHTIQKIATTTSTHNTQ